MLETFCVQATGFGRVDGLVVLLQPGIGLGLRSVWGIDGLFLGAISGLLVRDL